MPTFTTFDPYYKWLGIPKSEQPPNHYRLLGLNPFESDTEVIDSAADQRMDYLRTFQTGPCVDQSQQLLNQVAAARLCLMNPQRKVEYDDALRLRLTSRIPPSVRLGQLAEFFPRPATPGAALLYFSGYNGPNPVPVSPIATSPAPLPFYTASQPAPAPCSPAIDAPESSPGLPGAVELNQLGIDEPLVHHVCRRTNLSPVVWLSGPLIAGLVFAAAVIIVTKLRDGLETERSANGERNITQGLADRSAASRSSSQSTKLSVGKSPGRAAAQNGSRHPASVPSRDPRPVGAGDDQSAIEAPPAIDADFGREPESRRAPPGGPAQEAAVREIHDVMRQEFAAASAPAGEKQLAHKLAQLAAETNDDPAMRYSLLREALEAAMLAGDIRFTEIVVIRLTAEYEVDPWQLRLAALGRLLQSTASGGDRGTLIEQGLILVDKAVREDRYDVAGELAAIASSAADALGDEATQTRAKTAVANVKRIEAADAQANRALDRLQLHPDDADANLVVGRFRCFDKQDWQSGLWFLVRGGDAELQELARQELSGVVSSVDQLKLANAWWDLAERTKVAGDNATAHSLMAHAAKWYRQAAPNLSGLSLLKAEKRIAEAAPPETAQRAHD